MGMVSRVLGFKTGAQSWIFMIFPRQQMPTNGFETGFDFFLCFPSFLNVFETGFEPPKKDAARLPDVGKRVFRPQSPLSCGHVYFLTSSKVRGR